MNQEKRKSGKKKSSLIWTNGSQTTPGNPKALYRKFQGFHCQINFFKLKAETFVLGIAAAKLCVIKKPSLLKNKFESDHSNSKQNNKESKVDFNFHC